VSPRKLTRFELGAVTAADGGTPNGRPLGVEVLVRQDAHSNAGARLYFCGLLLELLQG
jgi:hypothetical protein